VVEAEERPYTAEEIRAKIAEAKKKKDAANLKPRDPKARRAAEQKQRKDRVNPALLRGQGVGPDKEPWTIRARPDLKRRVEELAEELSQPRAKVSIAALMEEAIEMLLAHYQAKAEEMQQ
jgi:hypothetical protein